jgi:hypothetical protein
MPIGEGWWIHPNGKVVPIHEHLSAVQSDPRAFGLTAREAAPLEEESELDQRARILGAVLRKGWIRVRASHGHAVFELWKGSRRSYDTICDFIGEYLGTGPGTHYQINEVSTRRPLSLPGDDCYTAAEALTGAALLRMARRAGLGG